MQKLASDRRDYSTPAPESGPMPFDDDAPLPEPPDENGSPYNRYKATEDAQPIALLDGRAIAAPLPDLEYLVREIGLVAGGGAAHLVAGGGFTAKTLGMQALGLALSAARPIWGAYVCRDARRVVHVDLEQGTRLTCRRYQRLAFAMGIDLAGLGDALAVAIQPAGLALTEACAAKWRELMKGRDLCIIDSLRAATAGQDENDSGIRAGLDLLGHVSEQTGCRALVIHHARKPQKDDPGGQYSIRGSGAIFDAVDSAYVFSAAKDEPVSVEHVKARTHGELVESFALVVSDVEINGDPRGGLRVQVHGHELVEQRRADHAKDARQEKARTDSNAVRAAIAATPGLGAMELRAATGLSGDRFAAAVAHLRDEIEVREERKGRGPGSRRHYLRGAPCE